MPKERIQDIISDEINREAEITADIDDYMDEVKFEEDTSEDVIRDYEDGEEIVEYKKPYTDEDIVTDSYGITRYVKSGKFVKGTKSPQRSRLTKMRQLVQVYMGHDMERGIQKLMEIAMYDPDSPLVYYDKETDQAITRPRIAHFYTANTQLAALTLLIKYFYGSVPREVNIDQNVEVKIEKKVADLTKLINQNNDRLKLVKGGK